MLIESEKYRQFESQSRKTKRQKTNLKIYQPTLPKIGYIFHMQYMSDNKIYFNSIIQNVYPLLK